eukprot:TRINITY_DN32454_c0_g1_i1.p1 TRINITY_DN32454_c0_g1~~TRINITY_DN32454_c0_g1_i1.p1  ORF type:complete len:527 (+),score=96.78 TRINITY_DN32454_c0_g1_i1:69-1649(+)
MTLSGVQQGRLRPDKGGLPPGWDRECDEAGRVFYQNQLTGERQWDRPAAPAAGPDRPPSRGSLATSCISAASGRRMDCICEICECGVHRCPEHAQVTPYGPICSKYAEDYPAHAIVPRHRPPAAPVAQTTAVDPSHFQTTHCERYPAHKIELRRARPKSAPPRRTHFSGRTTYQREHYARPVEQVRRRPPAQPPLTVPFEHDTVNRTTYAHPGAQPVRKPLAPPAREIAQTSFLGHSTYRDLYKPQAATPPVRVVPHAMHAVAEDRDFTTTKEHAFACPDVSYYERADKDFASPPVQVQPYGPIQSKYQEDYPAHGIVPRHRPPPAPAAQTTAVDGDHFNTTNGEAYRPHAVKAHRVRTQSAPPKKSRFRGETTYQREHYARPVEPVRRRPPQSALPTAPFDGTTTNRSTFANPGKQPTRDPLKPPLAEVTSQPFTGQSTYRQLYETHDVQTPQRPQPQKLHWQPEDRDFMTTKQVDYVPQKTHRCPAATLPRKRASRHTGHVHYHRRTQRHAVTGEESPLWQSVA